MCLGARVCCLLVTLVALPACTERIAAGAEQKVSAIPSASAPADGSVLAIEQSAAENQKKLGDCSLYPAQRSSPYVLPWPPGRAHLVWRTTDHFRAANGGVGLYALDIGMPISTPIVAARSGVVAATRDEFHDGNGEDLHENYVLIRHDDGTIGRYFHLTYRGARVQVDERVTQGQIIGLSGNTGQSSGAHLHFDVQRCGPNLPPGYNTLPCGQTLPLTFSNTKANLCGLMPGETYEAADISPKLHP